MSISDNEELDTKPSAAASARCHTMSTTSSDNTSAVSNINLQKTKQNNFDASSTSHEQHKKNSSIEEKKKLTNKEQMEYSYKCVATLLSLDNDSKNSDEVAFNNSISNKLDFGVMDLTTNNNINSNRHDDDKVEEIAVIPTLVSLSDTFFHQQPVGSAENNVAAASSSSMNFATLNNTSSTASHNNTSSTAGGQHNIQNSPSLRPRMSNTSSSRQPYSNLTGSGSLNNMNDRSSREGRPVGPQGALVPSHLLDELNGNVSQGGVGGGANQSSNSVGVARSNTSNHQNASLAQPPPNSPSRSFITTNLTTNTFNQSPGMNTNSPMGNRSRIVRERHAAGLQQQQRLGEEREPIYINAVQSLELAVKKLEVKLKERKDAKVEAASQSAQLVAAASNNTAAGSGSSRGSSAASSGSPRRRANSSSAAAGSSGGVEEKETKTIEQLESTTLIKLANIMFHPPTGLVDGLQYTWEDDDTPKRDVCTLAPTQLGQEDRDTDIKESSFEEEVISEEVVMGGGSMSMSLDESPPSPPTFKFKSSTLPTTPPNNRYPNIQSIQSSIIKLGLSIPTKRVCQYAFKKNDIVWVCRTCQSDETCVLCHECFSNSNHEGHDVSFYHASAGGCCDCGDADAWCPSGFCNKHGPKKDGDMSLSISAEPSVLGSVHAIADYLSEVVQSGVEDGYKRANPLLFVNDDDKKTAALLPAGFRSDSLLPDYYDQQDGGRVRREQMSARREHSLERRNTVADVESTTAASNPLPSSPVASPNLNDDADDDMSTSTPVPEDDNNNGMIMTRSRSNAASTGHPRTPVLHELTFDPSLASTSTKQHPKRSESSMSIDNVFDPEAASSPTRNRAKKKVRSSPSLSASHPEVKTPARTLGDLGREEHGLFLVLHSDDIHMRNNNIIGYRSEHAELIRGLKELYSTPGGGGGGGNAAISAAAATRETSLGLDTTMGRTAIRPGITNNLPIRDLQRERHRLLTPTFRAPHAEAILEKVVKIVKQQGDLIVWGTQEILAECGDVTARCWLDGDSNASASIGAAMLNRAKILTDHGLVCSIKTLKELRQEQKATAILKLVCWVASSCDPLCDQVALGLSGQHGGVADNMAERVWKYNALVPLLRNDLKLPTNFVEEWHVVLLKLLAVPDFKASMANAYCDSYRAVTKEYARGVGLLEQSSYTLAVQFLNRSSYVTQLVKERNLQATLSRCLLETMRSASFTPGKPGSPLPAGASSDMMNDLNGSVTASSSLTTAILSLLGFHLMNDDGDDEMGNAIDETLLHEIDTIFGGMVTDNNGRRSGGDSRHHGRILRSTRRNVHQSILERTSALIPPTLNPAHTVLCYRRYSTPISDMKCVLNVDGMARYFASLPIGHTNAQASGGFDQLSLRPRPTREDHTCALDDWIETLSLSQQMDGQMWRCFSQGHVETEPKGWIASFNLSISLSSLFERLLNWDDSDPSPVTNSSSRLLSCAELTHYVLAGLGRWQRSEMLSYRPTHQPSLKANPKLRAYALAPASLPFSTVASTHGSALSMTALPLPQIALWSFHLPLHRFVAACVREVSRRHDVSGSEGIQHLLSMFALSLNDDASSQLRTNALLFRGLFEFPINVLSKAAQIRAGIWRRNGRSMEDQGINYAEPPFCRPLKDADILLLQFGLICHSSQGTASLVDDSMSRGLVYSGQGTLRLVNLLLHRFGVFDFLGFEKSPNSNVERYKQELGMGLYPPELEEKKEEEEEGMEEGDDEKPSTKLVLPWTYCPVTDPEMVLRLVDELLHLIIILITEMPSPSPNDKNEHTLEAKRRLKREVIHRLVSGNKTHSSLSDVTHILPQRDNIALIEAGKVINPDDASGALLEDALNKVAIRKKKIGSPDAWELSKDGWSEYDPGFSHISTKDHQMVSENRPKPSSSSPYAPRPAVAHSSFQRIRRDLTADSCLLATVYRVLHVHCHQDEDLPSEDAPPGHQMYVKEIKSEQLLARAVHLLTLGAYAWEEGVSNNNWKELGGGDIGSVFYNKKETSAPTACDWITMAMLREPSEVMNCEWYQGKENTLTLLKRIVDGGQTGFLGGVDSSLQSGANWLCDFATRHCPAAAVLFGNKSTSVSSNAEEGTLSKDEEMARKKKAAKDRAMAMMKAQMAAFAANLGGSFGDDGEEDEDKDNEDVDQHMNEGVDGSQSPTRRGNSDDTSIVNTPTRRGLADDESTNDFDTPHTPRTPKTHDSGCSSTPQTLDQVRLFKERPRCIVCGGDTMVQTDDDDRKMPAASDEVSSQEDSLAFCGYSQASTVLVNGSDSHVGVHVTLCGHAIHKHCCDSYIRTTLSQRDDRGEGKRREFRCPLCSRLSNCLVPFVDVAADWVDQVDTEDKSKALDTFKSEDESMSIDSPGSCETVDNNNLSLQDFLSTTKWWATRNDTSVWDGQCILSTSEEDTKPSAEENMSSSTSSTLTRGRRQSLKKIQTKLPGKKELVSAWNSVLRTPRLVKRKRRQRSSSTADDRPGMPKLSDDSDLTNQEQSSSDVLRRFFDQISDVAHRGDIRRLGEDALFADFGEFRHYLTEKAVYNKFERAHGRELIEWPLCLSSVSTTTYREECSREKLISKLLFSIQAFTYTCCSEGAEARQVLRTSSASDRPSLISRLGIARVHLGSELMLFPEANPTLDDGFQPFDGRLGKLRYLALALMVATSPVAKEVIQLCMSFPFEKQEDDPFDFEADAKASIKRAPVVYPILSGHVLTHTTVALLAVTGSATTEGEGQQGNAKMVDDCRNLIQLGLVARTSQVLLAKLTSELSGLSSWEQQVCTVIDNSLALTDGIGTEEQDWIHFGLRLCRILLSPTTSESQSSTLLNDTTDRLSSCILGAIESAKTEAVAFLSDLSLISQILIPNIFGGSSASQDDGDDQSQDMLQIFKRFASLFRLESLCTMLESTLLQEIVKSWYEQSTVKDDTKLGFPQVFTSTWPNTAHMSKVPPTCLPLFGKNVFNKASDDDSIYRISYLPKSYTDLYAELNNLYPNNDQTAVCLVCGQVLNASGKGECTKHAYKCGGGAGIFFLVQDCMGLIVHGQKAAYINCPYVDSHGETPQYRGRPLYLDLDRYHIMKSLWSGHLIRERCIKERASTRQVIIPNYY